MKVNNGITTTTTGNGIVNEARSHYKLVKGLSDLPTPVNDEITLLGNTDYEINGIVDITPNVIINSQYSTMYGQNRDDDGFITDNVKPLISGNDTGANLRFLSLTNVSGPLFDVEDTAGNEKTHNFFAFDCILKEAAALGTFKNLAEVELRKVNAVTLATGATFEGSQNGTMRITGSSFGNASTGTVVDLTDAVFDAIAIDHNNINASVGLVLLEGLVDSGNIAPFGQGVVQSNTTYGGNFPIINGVTQKDARWNWGLNNNAPDSGAIGSLYMEDNSTNTIIPAASTPVKVAGTSIAGDNIQRFTMPTSNTLVYQGHKIFNSTVTYSISVKRSGGTGSRLLKATIYKNGSPMIGASQIVEVPAREVSLTVLANPTIYPNDTFELWISNEENDTDMKVTQMQCSIK